MPSETEGLIEVYMQHETPDIYLTFYNEVKTLFVKNFPTFYQKYVLDLPTLEKRWEAYQKVPLEWLTHSRWLIDIDAIVEVDGVAVNFELVENWVHNGYYDRGTQFDRDDIVEHIEELLWRMADLDEGFEVRPDYMFDKKYTRKLTVDIIDLWKESLINGRIGSFRNDW